MNKDFDDFVEGLQDQIFQETRAVYGDIAFQSLKTKIKTTQGSIAVSRYQKSIPPEKLVKPGLLRRFLNWIAKAADKSNMGKAPCPT